MYQVKRKTVRCPVQARNVPLIDVIPCGVPTTGKKVSKVSRSMPHDYTMRHTVLLQKLLLELRQVKIICIVRKGVNCHIEKSASCVFHSTETFIE